jgi:response regulator RpfG family c-di-GMP phosphodiesterase
MPILVLVIDDSGFLEEPVREALKGILANIKVVPKTLLAKQVIIQNVPQLIISLVDFDSAIGGGVQFCRELKGHGEFRDIPVILVAESPDSELMARAQEAQAHGLISLPLNPEVLKKRLRTVAGLGEFNKVQRELAAKVHDVAPNTEPNFEAKFLQAQKLLATVLNNLKTSDVLRVSETEDVPAIVLKMTQKICGIYDEDFNRKSGYVPSPTTLNPSFVESKQVSVVDRPEIGEEELEQALSGFSGLEQSDSTNSADLNLEDVFRIKK